MLFSKKDKAKAGPHSGMRTAVDIMLKPDIAGTMQPLRETTNVFIQLLALVFMGQGMFPRNHPALSGAPDAPHLSLGLVLGTAWRSLAFTRANIPQVLLFFAVLASLIFSVLAVAVFVLSLFIGKAHAQGLGTGCGSGYFTPCDPNQDIALSWINYIFNAQPMYNYLNQYGQVIPQFTTIQTALMSALGFYSDAILIVAAIILFYHLASMVVETAHHGVVMGKRANQIWAPIRLVVAIGLLVPIAGGLNSGQYIVITIAEWGSNLASQVWNVFVTNLANENYNGVAAIAPYARKAVYDTVMMEACAQTFNAYYNGANGSGSSSSSSTPGPQPACTYYSSMPECAGIQPRGPINIAGGAQKFLYDLPQGQTINADKGICGHYIFPPTVPTNDATAAMMQTQVSNVNQTAYTNMQQASQKYVQTHLSSFLPPNLGGTGDQPISDNTADFEQLVTDYQNSLQNGLSVGATANAQLAMADLATTSSAQGWVSAGAWFNTVARLQAEMMDVSGLVPGTQAPDLTNLAATDTFKQFVYPVVANFEHWFDLEDPQAGGGSSASSGQDQLQLAAAGFNQQDNHQPAELMDRIFAIVDWIASWNHVWQPLYTNFSQAATGQGQTPSQFTLGVQFLSANPLAEIAALGHANISTAYDLFDDYLLWVGGGGILEGIGDAGIAKGAGESTVRELSGGLRGRGSHFYALFGNVSKFGGAALSAVAPIVGFISVVFFTSGFMLAFFLPLIPFFRYLFNILTWIVSLLEAVVAVPLIALAHLNPEGDGLPGATGKTAYYFIFSIFLRPVMMVFGLIMALMIFLIAASYMNLLYRQAVAGTGGISHGHLTLARIVYSFLYILILYLAANSSFKMIGWLPEHAVKWMGGQALHIQSMGDPQELAQPLLLASGYVDQQLVKSAGPAIGGVGKALGGTVGRTYGGQVVGAAAVAGTLNEIVHGRDPAASVQKAADIIENAWGGMKGAGQSVPYTGQNGSPAITGSGAPPAVPTGAPPAAPTGAPPKKS